MVNELFSVDVLDIQIFNNLYFSLQVREGCHSIETLLRTR